MVIHEPKQAQIGPQLVHQLGAGIVALMVMVVMEVELPGEDGRKDIELLLGAGVGGDGRGGCLPRLRTGSGTGAIASGTSAGVAFKINFQAVVVPHVLAKGGLGGRRGRTRGAYHWQHAILHNVHQKNSQKLGLEGVNATIIRISLSIGGRG